MEFPFKQGEWKEILSRLYKRASMDHPFHVLCLRDAHAAIKLISGHDIPKTVHIRFEPQHSDEVLLVLPQQSKELIHPLQEHDLEDLAESMARTCLIFANAQESTFTQKHHSI